MLGNFSVLKVTRYNFFSELSEVLWSRVISGPSHLRGPLAPLFLYGAFAAWAVLTVTVLVLMEGLSAFLHTLRLHW